jgi:hypothetical protein
MKRVLVASILGLATIATTYGQANFLFDTYAASGGGNGGLIVVDSSLTPVADGTTFANLLWSWGTASGDLGLAIATTTLGSYGSGWIQGPGFTVPNYTSGTINFTIQAWQGASFAAALTKGTFSWTEAAVTPAAPGGAFVSIPKTTEFSTVPGSVLQLVTVPEPTTLALAGLGAAALLAYRRRQ